MGDQGFEFGGVHHVALVSSDMARTVDFYTNVLGMPLVKTWRMIIATVAGKREIIA